MGYYTDYTLSVYGIERDGNDIRMTAEIQPDVEKAIEAEIKKMDVFSDGDIGDSYYANLTWTCHEEDMRLLSSKFPNNLFWLSGQGEFNQDMWQKFFVNGRMQVSYARIIYEDFDAGKLDEGHIDDAGEQLYSYQHP